MQPFLLIMTFLLIFSFLTVGELKQLIGHSYIEKAIQSAEEKKESLEKLKKLAQLQNLRALTHDNSDYVVERKKEVKPKEKKERKKRSYKLNFDVTRPPNNSRLNVFLLLFEDDSKKQIQFENLIKELYSQAPFYSQIPDFERIISEKLLLEREKFKDAYFPDVLSILEFDDERLQEAFYLMLKGFEKFPSLLNYLTFDKKTTRNTAKINLLFASKELLLSTTANAKVTDRLLEIRNDLMAQILEPETTVTREYIQEYLKEKVVIVLMEENLPVEEYKKLFDFGLGKMGNIAFIEDPLTKKISREKLYLD